MKIKAAVVDDHDLTRIAVEDILSRAPDIDFVGNFPGVGTLLEAEHKVNVLLLGYARRQTNFPSFLTQVMEEHPEMRIIVLGQQWTEARIRKVLDAGAQGVVDRDEALNDLLAPGIRRVAEGKQFLSPEVAELLYVQSVTNDQLDECELDVVHLMDAGASTKEMAAALGVNRRSIYRTQKDICRKWNLRSKDQIVPEAIRRGIIKP